MCGISGIATQRLDRAELEGSIKRMARTIRHRGPDGLDFRCFAPPVISQNVALAHNRLAIIDISPAGSEPMSNEDGTVWLVFNGEIYNFQELRLRLESRGHRFHSHTDAEVIVHLYEEVGTACVEELDGIFAFAILDLRRDLLFLARDPDRREASFLRSHPRSFPLRIGNQSTSRLVNPHSLRRIGRPSRTFLHFCTSRVRGQHSMASNSFLQPTVSHCSLQDNSISLTRYWDVARREDLESISVREIEIANPGSP